MYLLWILGWVYLRQKSGANRMHQRKNVTNENPHQKYAGLVTHNNTNPIGRCYEENPLALGLKTKHKHNYQPFHLHRGIIFSCSKWAVRINHCSLCEFISCSVLSSFHKGVMDHQFASSVSSLAATLQALSNFKNRLTTESAKKC